MKAIPTIPNPTTITSSLRLGRCPAVSSTMWQCETKSSGGLNLECSGIAGGESELLSLISSRWRRV